MTITNGYCTLADFKTFATSRGQTATSDAVDDGNIEVIIDSVSRYFDDMCHRTFYPRYEIRSFSVPVLQNSPRLLFLDDDLLQEVTITNGDTTVITNAWYNLRPKNYSPKFGIQLIGPSSRFWIFNGIGSIEYVITVEGWWGFHNHYDQRAWTKIGTLGAAITDTTTLTATAAAGFTGLANNIVKIDSEILNIASFGTNTITAIQRGDNGSTPATHTNGAAIYRWNVIPELVEAVKELALIRYAEKTGQPQDKKSSTQKVIDATVLSLTRPL